MATNEDKLPPPAIFDTVTLSNFAFTRDLALLDTLPVRIVTVETVIDELRAGIDGGHEFLERAINVVEVVDSEEPPEDEDQDAFVEPDPGETHALHVAQALGGTLVTDDLEARQAADERDVAVTGSIGILIRLVRRDELSADEADAILHRWIEEAGYRSPVESIREVL